MLKDADSFFLVVAMFLIMVTFSWLGGLALKVFGFLSVSWWLVLTWPLILFLILSGVFVAWNIYHYLKK